MSVAHGLRNWLLDPDARAHDLDGVDASLLHRRAVERKPLLRELFATFYDECRASDARYFGDVPGARVEIGSGAGIIKMHYPDVLTSDLKALPFVDVQLRAEALPFAARSLRAIYAVNVFHHLGDPRRFFGEALRALATGGGVVLIEPYHGPVARWLFPRLHASEGYDPDAADWNSACGPMSGANQALSYVVFERDRSLFEREFPAFELVALRPHTHVAYLASGGVNFRQLVPNLVAPAVRLAERSLTPLNRWIALQHTVVLRKRREATT